MIAVLPTHPPRVGKRGGQHRDVWVLRKCLEPQSKQERQLISEVSKRVVSKSLSMGH